MNAERTLMVLIGFHLLSRNFVPDTKTFILMKFNFVYTLPDKDHFFYLINKHSCAQPVEKQEINCQIFITSRFTKDVPLTYFDESQWLGL